MPGMNGDVVIAKIKKIFSEYALFKNYLPYICILSSLAENSDEIRSAVKAGADVLVAGSFVFNSENPSTTIDHLKNI